MMLSCDPLGERAWEGLPRPPRLHIHKAIIVSTDSLVEVVVFHLENGMSVRIMVLLHEFH